MLLLNQTTRVRFVRRIPAAAVVVPQVSIGTCLLAAVLDTVNHLVEAAVHALEQPSLLAHLHQDAIGILPDIPAALRLLRAELTAHHTVLPGIPWIRAADALMVA